ncbi:MAG: response regulator [Bacterioplanes sp.]|nr:response regulator [Bacterioplanes sp.]
MNRILLVDDDRELVELLQEYLTLEGFQVSAEYDGERGLAAALSGDFDLLLLDVMLPTVNGFDVLRRLRDRSSLPVIMLTARGESIDRVLGLEHGADDYIAKPYHHHELVARINALLRRVSYSGATPLVPSPVLQVDDLRLDRSTLTVTRANQTIDLTGAEFGVLCCLLEHPGVLVDKDTLAQAALGRSLMAYDRSIDMHVSNVRKKLGKRDDGSDWIKTVRGRGYLLVGH